MLSWQQKTRGDEMSLVQFNKVYKQFAGDFILKDISFSIEEKDKIGLVGLNGVGKSTIIRMLLGKERVDGAENNPNEIGEIIKSPSMRIGYLSQNHEFSDERNTIYEEMMSVFSEEREIWNKLQKVNMLLGTAEGEELENLINQSAELSSLYEAKNGYEIEYKIKQILTGLELTDEYYNLYLKDLSGGERTRVSLAKLLLIEPDLLILDEPTNHLDIYSIEVLEDALENFDGTMLVVSHNRHFLDSVCNTIYYLDENGLTKFKGNYEDYKESLKNAKTSSQTAEEIEIKEERKLSYQEQKELSKKISKLKRDVAKLEDEMEKITVKREELNIEYETAGKRNDLGKLMEIQGQFDKLEEEEMSKMEEWDEKSEELKKYM